MNGKPSDKPPRPAKPIGGAHAPSRPVLEREELSPDSLTAARRFPSDDDPTQMQFTSDEDATQMRVGPPMPATRMRVDTPMPAARMRVDTPMPATQMRVDTPMPPTHALAAPDERGVGSANETLMVAPDTRGADSPNETLMLPQRPVSIPAPPMRAAMPSQPVAFAPPPAAWSQPPPPQPQMRPQSQSQPQLPPRPHIYPMASNEYPALPRSSPASDAPFTSAPSAPSAPNAPSAPPAAHAPRGLRAPPAAHAPRGLRAPPTADDAAPVSTGGAGPGSFSRIFLGSVEKYRGKSGNVGSASQEAAAALAQSSAPKEQRASAPTLRLRSPLALVEALGLTLLLPTLGWLVDHQDPFFLNHHFSWIVAAPLLLGLRHGFAPALASAVVLDGLIAAAWRTQLVPIEQLPGETMVGIAALAMITGQFSDVWKRELVRLDGGFEVLRKQLGEVMRSHFLLELSHDRLEERMGKGTPNLRDALVALHRAVSMAPGTTLADLSDTIVDIFSTYTMIEVGAVYRAENDRLVPEPVAKIGRPGPLDLGDEQVREALRTKKLTYIRGSAASDASAGRTKLLAVVPFVDTHQRLHGMLLVESIPLLAFERRNLESLAILGGRFADAVASGGKDTGVQRGQKKELEVRLRRAIRDLVENDVASTLFVLLVRKGGAASDSIETVLGGTLRALDFPYVERDALGNYVVYILLPLTDEAGARAFAARIERIVRRESSMPLARAGAFNFHHVLRPDDTVEGVMTKLEAKAKLDEASVEHTIVV